MDSDLSLAGLAAACATTITNPFEVVKTRMQLQGELSKPGSYVTPYKGVLNVFVIIIKNDGILGLQKGLVPAVCCNYIFNCLRLSVYTYAMDQDKSKKISFGLGFFWGAVGGAIGSYASSPFFMIKTQLQAQSVQAIAVGFQHNYRGMYHAFREIYSQGGVSGLWRGSLAGVARSAIGSATQMSTYDSCKAFLYFHELLADPIPNALIAGLFAGTTAAVIQAPFDVATTRLYNQGIDENGNGLLYKGWLDCFVKIFRTEGLLGLFKGFWANYFRLAPHSMVLLLCYDELLSLRNRYRLKKTSIT